LHKDISFIYVFVEEFFNMREDILIVEQFGPSRKVGRKRSNTATKTIAS
jgi:hypothetical protein